jgi:hypothetical protein
MGESSPFRNARRMMNGCFVCCSCMLLFSRVFALCVIQHGAASFSTTLTGGGDPRLGFSRKLQRKTIQFEETELGSVPRIPHSFAVFMDRGSVPRIPHSVPNTVQIATSFVT